MSIKTKRASFLLRMLRVRKQFGKSTSVLECRRLCAHCIKGAASGDWLRLTSKWWAQTTLTFPRFTVLRISKRNELRN